jgi:DNA polymerase I-like protein with 3'-5' exonuclease and polymerase domains
MIDLSKCYVYDIEADGLLDTITKIHCLSVGWRDTNGNFRITSTTDYDVMRKFFNKKDIKRIGHNITLYDEKAVNKILGIDTLSSKDQIIDTLALSWYLYPERLKHGLEDWGRDLGVKKVEIKDWKNLSSEEYVHRCEEDVKINFKLWEKSLELLSDIYDTESEIVRLINYLQFKLDCVREQEDTKIKLNVLQVMKDLDDLKNEKLNKEDILRRAMPKVPIKTTKKYKNVIVLEDGSLYQKGELLYEYYIQKGYKPKFEHEIDVIKGYKEPNPNSNTQKKDWLYSLGWQPRTFEYKKNDDGSQRKIPQIGDKKKDGTLCESVQELFEKEPRLEVLEGLSIISHRIGTLEGFLENQINGYIEPSMAGLTNTLRLKHAKIVNLPGVDKKYGKQIRGALIASEGEILCGSDMSSLEDSTKQHYMYFYDPVYVTEMRTPGFDPHLDIGVLSGLLTEKEEKYYKWVESEKEKDKNLSNYDKVEYNRIKVKRHTSKTVNFASVYGAGPPKIALTANIPLKEAKKLHETYWKRNKAVKQVSDAAIVKTVSGKKWLFNPVSKFWYSLRAEKDKFSTLNQGTGVYCFDMYIKKVREKGIKISLQMHDEILFRLSDDPKSKERIIDNLQTSIREVNEEIKLNIPLGISIDFGYNYADCH